MAAGIAGEPTQARAQVGASTSARASRPQAPARAWALPPERRIWAALGLVIGLALIARIVLAARNEWPSVDGVDYMTQARNLVRSGRLPYSTFPPGWPLIIAIPLLLLDLGDPLAPLRAAQAANVVLGALLPLLAFLAVRRRLGERWALGVAALLAFLPHDLALSKGDLSEMSYACALLGACLLLEAGSGAGRGGRREGGGDDRRDADSGERRDSGPEESRDARRIGRRRFLAGLGLGYAYLIRPEALVVVAGICVWLLLRERRAPWPLLLGAIIPVVPYVAFVHAQTGHWALSGKSVFLAQAWQHHPGLQMVPLYLHNAGAFLLMLTGLIGLPIALLAGVGAVTAAGPWLLYLVPLAALPLFDFVMAPRYWIPYLPFVLWGAALGAARLVARWGTARRAAPDRRAAPVRRVVPALLLVASLAGLGVAARDDIFWARVDPEFLPGLREAGLWLRDRVGRSTGVADYKPYAAFWADCRFVPLAKADSARTVIDAARQAGAEYIIVNVHEVAQFVPALDPLLWVPPPSAYAEEVTSLKTLRFEDDPRQNTVVYGIKGKR